jgi:protein TonB
MKYLSKNVKYPEDCKKEGIHGRVIVQFVVDQDGSIKNAMVVRGIHPSLDKEALRVVEAMPKWKPGKQDGQTVKVKYTIPVSFKLQ